MTIYVILSSGADADRGIFNSGTAEGGYFSRERAQEAFSCLVSEKEKEMEIPFDPADYREEYTPDYWEAWQDGYAAGWFTRYEIIPVECEASS